MSEMNSKLISQFSKNHFSLNNHKIPLKESNLTTITICE